MIFIVTTLNFKDIIDLPKWRRLATPIASGLPPGLTSDLRNNEDRHPFIYHVAGAPSTALNAYNVKNDEWMILLAIGGGVTTNSLIIMPSQGPLGSIAAGATTTSIPLTTALPATVAPNQIANRGDGRGFKVRIIGNAAGSSGKTEERLVIANTGPSTTPTLTLDSPLSFTPILGDTYQFLSGKLYQYAGTPGASSFSQLELLTNTVTVLSTVNVLLGTDSILLGLDELYVPYDRSPGEGFFGILTATASAAATLTGHAVGGDAGVVANQYRNFQIRIIEDTAIPTAVGQRRNITSHTAGPSPVYTVPAWAVQPSANALYVIENNRDRIIRWIAGSTVTNTYTISTNTWDQNVTFAARPAAPAAGVTASQAFSIEPDIALNARQSFIYSFRGGSTTTLDLFDIAGAATGLWTGAIPYFNNFTTFDSPGGFTQDSATMEGRYIYLNRSTPAGTPTVRFYRFDMKNRVLEPSTILRATVGTTVGSPQISPIGRTLAQSVFIDGSTKLSFIYFLVPDTTTPTAVAQLFGLPITR